MPDLMIAPVEIPYVVPPDASQRCRDLVSEIMDALGMPNQDEAEHEDRILALSCALAAEIARGGDTDLARSRYMGAGRILSQIGPQCIERARQIRETDKSRN
jgi:hypothetical protein